MGKVVRILLILVSIVISFSGLSFGDQLEKGKLPGNSFQESIGSPLILPQETAPPFSLYEKAGSANTFYRDKPTQATKDQEFPSNFEEKSSYHFGKRHLARNNLDFSFNVFSSLSGVKYKEENPLSWTLQKFKENDSLQDILKPLGILLEIKLNF